MVKLTVNPNVEASVAFDTIKPCTTKMRIKEVTGPFPSTATPGNEYLKMQLEYVDPTSLETVAGGIASNPGTIFDNSCLITPSEKQGKLRSVVQAAGLVWSDFDTEDLMGREVTVKIGTEEYKGELKNVIKRYLTPD